MQKDTFVVATLGLLVGKGESAVPQEIIHHNLRIFSESQLKFLCHTGLFGSAFMFHTHFYMGTV